jgi:hypothetical protein
LGVFFLFAALNVAHLAFCLAAIFLRANADMVRLAEGRPGFFATAKTNERLADSYDGDLPGAQRNVARSIDRCDETGDIGGQMLPIRQKKEKS